LSIIPSQLNLSANLTQIEQNQTVILSARLLDQFGNPLVGQSVTLFVNHSSYSAPVRLGSGTTNAHGTYFFETELGIPGDSTLSAKAASLDSAPLTIHVFPSILQQPGPKTWPGVTKSLTRLEIDLSTVIGQMLAKSFDPTKEELCKPLGLDYHDANDRNRISTGLYSLKRWFDYLWRILYQQSPAFGHDFSTFMNDSTGFESWKVSPDSPYSYLKSYYGQSDDEIRHLWAQSRMWDHFVQIANQYNLHLLTAYYDNQLKVWRYKQPNFWEYVDKQIQSASRLGKGMATILARHLILGMILTSGEPISRALDESQRVQKMITERTPPKFRCVKCMRIGVVTEVSSHDELADHFKTSH